MSLTNPQTQRWLIILGVAAVVVLVPWMSTRDSARQTGTHASATAAPAVSVPVPPSAPAH